MIPVLYAAAFALGVYDVPWYGTGKRLECEGCSLWFWPHERHDFAACVAARKWRFETMQFTEVPQTVFDKLKLAMVRGGVEVHDHHVGEDMRQVGAFEGHNVTGNWRYDPSSATLQVDIAHHPFFMPESFIEHAMEHELEAIRREFMDECPDGAPPAEVPPASEAPASA